MDTRILRQIIAIDQHGSMRKAAEVLGLTQPALSHSVKAIEEELSFRIFERNKKGMVPTALGQIVLDRTRHLMSSLDSLEREVKMQAGLQIGYVSFGVGPTFLQAHLAEVISSFHKKYPTINMSVQSTNTANLLHLLETGEIEFFVAEYDSISERQELVVRPLPDQTSCFVVSRDHPLAQRGRIHPSELRTFPIAVPRMSQEGLDWIRHRVYDDDGHNVPHLQCDDYGILLKLVEEDGFVGGGNLAVLQSFIREGKVSRIDVEHIEEAEDVSLGIVSAKSRSLMPASLAFMEQILRVTEPETGN